MRRLPPIRLMLALALGLLGLTAAPASALADAPPTIAASFSPSGIAPNGTSTLTITITNPATNSSAASGVSFTDNLPSFVSVATPNDLGNTCGGTATATAGSGAISLAGGTIPIGASCTVTADVTASTTGAKTDDTGPVSSNEGGSGDPAQATLNVANPPTISKLFDNDTVPSGNIVGLSFTISNPNSDSTPPDSDVTLTGATFTDSLPAGMEVANPSNAFTDCGGTLTAVPGSSSISLTGGTVPVASENNPSGACFVAVDLKVTASQGATLHNTSGPISANESGPGQTSNTATVTVGPAPVGPVLTKSFAAAAIAVGQSTSLTFTISNPNTAVDFISAGFTDTLPAGLAVASPASVGGSCVTDHFATVTAAPGSGSVALSELPLVAGDSCTVIVDVAGTSAATANNTTTPTATYDNGAGTPTPISGNGASASLTVVGPPSLNASFNPATIRPGATTSLSFVVRNPNASTALSGVGFSDALPTGLRVANPNGLTGSCGGGTISASAGGSSISLAGASLAATQSCTFSVNVTASGNGQLSTTTSTIGSSEGGAGGPATASVTVAAPPSIGLMFTPWKITKGHRSTLTFTLRNPNSSAALTGLTFSDHLPSGLVVANPAAVRNGCGGTTRAGPGSGAITLSQGQLAAGRTCTVALAVFGSTTATKTTTTSAVGSTEGGPGNSASGSLTVTLPSNAFTVTRIRPQRHGNVVVDVKVPGPGAVDVLVTAWNNNVAHAALLQPAKYRFVFSRCHGMARHAGGLRVTAKPSGKGRRLLNHPRYRVVVRVWVTFTPTGGTTAKRGAYGLHFGR
jgi:hypothetical protein